MRSVPAGPWYPFAPSGGETIAHMVTSCRSTWVAAVLLMLVSGAVGAQAAGGTAELELVPHPDLSGLSPEIRERLEPATEYFRSQRATLEGRSLGLAYGRMGINYLAHGQQEAAGACLRNAAILDPENPRWPYLLAVHYEQTGFLDKAVDSYRAALTRDVRYLPGYIRLGRVLLELDRPVEAEAAFQVVLNANPDDAAALEGMGRVAFGKGEYAKAVDFYQQALAQQPEASAVRYRLALAYREIGEADKADAEMARKGEVLPVIDLAARAAAPGPLVGVLRLHDRRAAGSHQGPDRGVNLRVSPAPTGVVDRQLQLVEAVGGIPGLGQNLPDRTDPDVHEAIAERFLTLGARDNELLGAELLHRSSDLFPSPGAFVLEPENLRRHSAAVHQDADPRILVQEVFVQLPGLTG